MNWALKQQLVKDSGACWVLMGLANHAREDGTAAFPSIATLMEYTKLSDRTIQQKLKKLLDGAIGQLGVLHQRGDRRECRCTILTGMVSQPHQHPARARVFYELLFQRPVHRFNAHAAPRWTKPFM